MLILVRKKKIQTQFFYATIHGNYSLQLSLKQQNTPLQELKNQNSHKKFFI